MANRRIMKKQRKNTQVHEIDMKVKGLVNQIDELSSQMAEQTEILGLFYGEYQEMKKMNEKKYLMKFIRMREDLRKDIIRLHRQGYSDSDEAILYLKIYADTCTDILEENGVEILSCKKGDKFQREIQKPLKSEQVANPEKHNTIVEVYGNGYKWKGIMLQKMNVAVGIY